MICARLLAFISVRLPRYDVESGVNSHRTREILQLLSQQRQILHLFTVPFLQLEIL